MDCHEQAQTPPPGGWETCEHCGGETQFLTTADFTARKKTSIDPVTDDQNRENVILGEKKDGASAQATNDPAKAEEAITMATKDAEPAAPCPSTPMPGQTQQEETRVPAPGTPARIATAAPCSPPRVPAPGTPARISTAAPTSPTFRAAQMVPNVAGSNPQPDQEHTQKSKRKTKVFAKSQTAPPETKPCTSIPKEKPDDCASSSSDKAARKKRSKRQAR